MAEIHHDSIIVFGHSFSVHSSCNITRLQGSSSLNPIPIHYLLVKMHYIAFQKIKKTQMVRAACCFVNFNKQNAVHIFRANCRHACQQQLAEDSQSRNWDEHAGSISRDGNKVFTCMMFDGTYDYGREWCASLKSGCDGQCNSYALRSPFPAKSRCPGWDTNVTTMQRTTMQIN